MSDEGLVAAVLLRAVIDACRRPRRRQDKYSRRIELDRSDAMRWLHCNDRTPWSARWCSDIAGYDLDEIRRQIRIRPASIFREYVRNKEKRGDQ